MKSTSPVFLLLLLIFYTSCDQGKSTIPEEAAATTSLAPVTSPGPTTITRTIIQDSQADLWIAAFDGVFRYDGTSFTHVTRDVSSSRFFTVLEDRKGNLWFGSVGSGVYRYDGKTFDHFSTDDGLLNDEVVSIFEDRSGHIWLGANGGVSRYNGQSFQNYKLAGDTIIEDRLGEPIPAFQRPVHEVTSMVEDGTGKLWMGTRENAFVYDGDRFSSVNPDGKPFGNVRCIIKDKQGRIWLGGDRGLWRYQDQTFTQINQDFVGYIFEDKRGNLWTSSETSQGWVLSRYDEASLTNEKPTATDVGPIYAENRGMLFGIAEAADGSIWFGALDGAYRFNGSSIDRMSGTADLTPGDSRPLRESNKFEVDGMDQNLLPPGLNR